jgi:uncharacterized protein (TIGR03437 family)
MPLVRMLPLALLSVWRLLGANPPSPRVAPFYDAASIVNAADNQSGALAPNTIATIYGTNLSYNTAALTGNDVAGGVLPTVLGTDETQVFINNIPADLYYVSPTQINFLVPPNITPGPATVAVFIDGLYGPQIQLTLTAAAPGLFQLDATHAVATFPDGSVLTASSPAQSGDIVILWATGLGPVTPPALYSEIPAAAAPLVVGANLSILLNGAPVPADAIDYAGVAPGFAGLYQINLTLPTPTPANPEIRLSLDGQISIPQIYLPVMVN